MPIFSLILCQCVLIKKLINGIDRLNQLPERTVAKQYADASYEAYLRDFSEVSGLVAGNNRINKIIAVAEKFQAQASNSCPDSFHSASGE